LISLRAKDRAKSIRYEKRWLVATFLNYLEIAFFNRD